MNDRLVRLSEVVNLTGISTSTIRRLEKQGVFPPRLQISANVVAWRLHDIDKWIDNRRSATKL